MEPLSAAELLPCRFQYVASLVGGCPDDRCPLWQPGDNVFGGDCVYDELNVPDRPTFEAWLLHLRAELGRAHTADERNELRQLFYRLLNESTRAEGLRDCRIRDEGEPRRLAFSGGLAAAAAPSARAAGTHQPWQ